MQKAHISLGAFASLQNHRRGCKSSLWYFITYILMQNLHFPAF